MQRLSDFDQASLRTYIQIVLAFPLAGNASAQAIYQHLRTSLTRVGSEIPVLASKIHLQNSRFGEEAFIQLSPEDIPLVAEIGGTNYADLAARGFPAQEFIRPDLDLNSTLKLNEGPVPVAHVRVNFINGGLLLILSLNHSAGDGYCLGQFAEAFASATRGDWMRNDEFSSKILHLPQDEEISSATLKTLSEQCPEFEVLLNPNPLPSLPDILPGGTPSEAIPSEAKIFVFKIDKLEQLRDRVREVWGPTAKKPSVFEVFSALTWAHVTKARLRSEADAPPLGDSNVAKLFTPVDFRRRFHEETIGYFGNAVVTLPTESSIQDVESACGDKNVAALAKLVAQIATTISDVDQAAILRREALFRRLGDLRRLVLSQDRRLPGQLQFNSWRYFGANFRWRIPGMGEKKPDSVRRITGEVSPGSALILPLNSESEVYELLLSLPTASMSALVQDEEWMNWVDRVID